MNASNTNK